MIVEEEKDDVLLLRRPSFIHHEDEVRVLIHHEDEVRVLSFLSLGRQMFLVWSHGSSPLLTLYPHGAWGKTYGQICEDPRDDYESGIGCCHCFSKTVGIDGLDPFCPEVGDRGVDDMTLVSQFEVEDSDLGLK